MEIRSITRVILGLLGVMASLKCWGVDLSPHEGVFGVRASYFKVFVSESLLDSYPKRYCQFVKLPAFEASSAIFISYSPDMNSHALIYRSFERSLWNDLVKRAKDKKVDPFVNFNQAILLNEINPKVIEKKVSLSEERSDGLIGLCDEILSGANFSSTLARSFDGDHLYFYHHDDKSHVSGVVDQSDESRLHKLYKTLRNLMEEELN